MEGLLMALRRQHFLVKSDGQMTALSALSIGLLLSKAFEDPKIDGT